MESVRTLALRVPQSFSFSKIGAPVASVMNKVATVEWLRSLLECWCWYRVCESQCEGERHLRALLVHQLHRQPTPVRQYPPAVHWPVQMAVTRNISSSTERRSRKAWLRSRGRTTWPEDVAERRGRKVWLRRRGRTTWPENMAERRGRKA